MGSSGRRSDPNSEPANLRPPPTQNHPQGQIDSNHDDDRILQVLGHHVGVSPAWLPSVDRCLRAPCSSALARPSSTDGRIADLVTLFILKVAQVRRRQARESKSFPPALAGRLILFTGLGGVTSSAGAGPQVHLQPRRPHRCKLATQVCWSRRDRALYRCVPSLLTLWRGSKRVQGRFSSEVGVSSPALNTRPAGGRRGWLRQTLLSSWWSSVKMDTGCRLLVPKGPLILAPATDSSTCFTLTLTGEFSDRHKVLLFTSQQVGASSDPVVFADDEFLTRLVSSCIKSTLGTSSVSRAFSSRQRPSDCPAGSICTLSTTLSPP